MRFAHNIARYLPVGASAKTGKAGEKCHILGKKDDVQKLSASDTLKQFRPRRYALRVATGVNEAQGMTETAAEMGQSDPGPVPPDPFPVVGALWPFRRVTKRKATIPGEKPNFQTEAVNEFGRK